MHTIFTDVKEFAEVADSMNIVVSDKHDLLQLCFNLIEEEVVKETLPAIRKYNESGSLENLAEAVDGAIDSIYVLAFFLNQMGLDAEAHWRLVHHKNMAKFPGGVAIKNELGKVQKPPGWTPPDHLPLLIEWNSKLRGERYVGGLIRHQEYDPSN
jgi:predicted HAD superfamily Cof-like phosphohydrolase